MEQRIEAKANAQRWTPNAERPISRAEGGDQRTVIDYQLIGINPRLSGDVD